MPKFIVSLLLCFALAGCASFGRVQNAFSVLTETQISPTAAVVAANTFNALEATATNYLRLKRCTGANGPICRDPAITTKIVPAVRSGRAARDALIKFVRQHPGQLGASGLYDALVASTSTLQAVYAQYGNWGEVMNAAQAVLLVARFPCVEAGAQLGVADMHLLCPR